jgi:choline dehydrogenase-like flavoprotein
MGTVMTIDGYHYDVCIIGAGVAGALVAYRLGRAGAKVVILEAGPRHSVQERYAYMQRYLAHDNPWQSDNPPRDHYTNGGVIEYPLNNLRVKAVGGTTLHWGGATPRLHESDFAMRSRYGIAADWPITYRELEPYYSEAEAELGVAGEEDNPFGPPRSKPYPLPGFPVSYHENKLRQAGESLGIQFHTLPGARTSVSYRGRPACLTFATCKVCPIRAKYSADVHVELAESTGNVTVIPHAAAVRIEVDQRRRVTRIVYATPDKVEHQATASIFIIAAHAVESARLLLLSTSAAFPHGLANASGLVGKYFMEHIAYRRLGRVDTPLFPYRIGFDTIYSEQFYDKTIRDREAALIISGSAVGPQPPQIVREVINSSGNWGMDLERELRQILQEEFGKTFGIEIMYEPLPVETNRVELDGGVKDDFGNPCPKIFYTITEYEKATFRGANQIVESLFGAMGAQMLDESKIGFGGHQSGTCRMGNDPKTSVVDRNLRAHEIQNLYLVGSSVFPTIGVSMPTLTIAALALRLGDYLLSIR